jgi:hypothetical protein
LAAKSITPAMVEDTTNFFILHPLMIWLIDTFFKMNLLRVNGVYFAFSRVQKKQVSLENNDLAGRAEFMLNFNKNDKKIQFWSKNRIKRRG